MEGRLLKVRIHPSQTLTGSPPHNASKADMFESSCRIKINDARKTRARGTLLGDARRYRHAEALGILGKSYLVNDGKSAFPFPASI